MFELYSPPFKIIPSIYIRFIGLLFVHPSLILRTSLKKVKRLILRGGVLEILAVVLEIWGAVLENPGAVLENRGAVLEICAVVLEKTAVVFEFGKIDPSKRKLPVPGSIQMSARYQS
ncbi:hypothetical protein ACSVDE_12065 [Pseudalkalibacillus sp. Hm43]|uniref:hypothetical protein n=1 Tax=Pseudalkalibacillus sp. Hm43 TaxID=3450742 RepID=UPI003F43FECA